MESISSRLLIALSLTIGATASAVANVLSIGSETIGPDDGGLNFLSLGGLR
jgi:hypothetical protein